MFVLVAMYCGWLVIKKEILGRILTFIILELLDGFLKLGILEKSIFRGGGC